MDLPTEIIVQIYFDLDSLSDILSLSSTCKTTRSVYDYDYRIVLKYWPDA